MLHVHSLSPHQQIKIDQMGVEVRTIDAGKFGLAAHLDATDTAHAGTIDHNRIEADNRRNLVGQSCCRHGAHHRHRADAKDAVKVGIGIA